MRAHPTLLFLILMHPGCGPVKGPEPPPPNRWSNEHLLPVLEAQEHRNTAALCALLYDTSATIRSAAALAFASVQDSLAKPCLLEALHDSVVEVRVNAVFALGLIADEGTLEHMADISSEERDSSVQRAYMGATFLNLQRRGELQEVEAIVYYLERSQGQERCRTADALRRLPPLSLRSTEVDLLRLTREENDPEVQAILIRCLGQLDGNGHFEPLREWALHGRTPSIRISAIRALGRCFENDRSIVPYALLADPEPMVRAATLEQFNGLGKQVHVDSLLAVLPRIDRSDASTWYPVIKLLMQQKNGAWMAHDSLLAHRPDDPYARAAWLSARTAGPRPLAEDSLRAIMLGDDHPAVRLVAFEALDRIVRWRMTMPRAITPEMQQMAAAPFYRTVFSSGDAGLICAAAEQLQFTTPEALRILFPRTLEEEVLATLRPVQYLEALMGLRGLAARRDGLTPPTDPAPAFNHPIDKTRLLALKQGQRYHIHTRKGEIILATDVNACPGSSLAFDSLVMAGYYDGKAFHRVVPDFVAQGGCPRGDGYGGMPWTLRTEIGRAPFTTGSVGLASAGRDTESCQFFITHSPAPHLDGRYTRFGEVVQGMDVVWQLQEGDVMERVERIE